VLDPYFRDDYTFLVEKELIGMVTPTPSLSGKLCTPSGTHDKQATRFAWPACWVADAD